MTLYWFTAWVVCGEPTITNGGGWSISLFVCILLQALAVIRRRSR